MCTNHAATTFSRVGREGGDIYKRHNLRIVTCLRNGHSTPTVTDKDNRTRRVCDDAFGCSEVVLKRRQRNLYRDDPMTLRLQQGDDPVPTRSISPCAMDQYNCGFYFSHDMPSRLLLARP
jgi:hypothetical protein